MAEPRELLDIVYDDAHPEDCRLDMVLPGTDEPCPVLVFFHGGGLEAGSRKEGEREAIWRLARDGIAVISADYRMYPRARFPDYLRDAARAFAWAKNYRQGNLRFREFYLGGSSAGGYISMMLCFDRRYLGEYGLSPDCVAGYVFDAGQPTVHYNVLRERGIDTEAIRVDEAAPLYHLSRLTEVEKQPRFLVLAAENDIPCRLEQTELLLKTMELLGYDMSRVTYRYMAGFSHCGYTGALDEDGEFLYYKLLRDFIWNQSV